MKIFLFFLLTLSAQIGYGQNSINLMEKKDTSQMVTLITIFDKSNATKDGYYVEGYVVELSKKQAKQLDGKKIQITGRVEVVKGLKNEDPQYDENGKVVIKQGREEDTKHIINPTIEIVH